MKKRRLLLIILLLALLFPVSAFAGVLENLPVKKDTAGEDVVVLQQRLIDLGYLHFRATGSFGDMTESAMKAFQKRNDLSATGVVDTATYYALFSKSVVRARAGSIIRVSGPVTISKPEEYGKLVSWKEIAEIFPLGTEATVTDLYTGYTYTVLRTGGTNHADVQTVGDASNKMFLKSFGGSYTWEKTPSTG